MPQLDNSLPPGLAGFMATRQANQQSDQSNLSNVTGIAGLLAKLQEQERAQRFRSEMAGATTPDEQARVASKYASPADIFKRTQESADVKARVEATKAQNSAKIQQAAQQFSSMMDLRIRSATRDDEKLLLEQQKAQGMMQFHAEHARQVGEANKYNFGIPTQPVSTPNITVGGQPAVPPTVASGAPPLMAGLGPQPAPAIASQIGPQTGRPTVAMQEPAPTMAARDQAASQVLAGNTPNGTQPALATNAVVPSVPPPTNIASQLEPQVATPGSAPPRQLPQGILDKNAGKVALQKDLDAQSTMSQGDLVSAGAQHASGLPLNRIVPGFGKNPQRERVRSEAVAQIKAQNPGMTDAQAGEELANRQISYVASNKSVGQLNTMLGATRQAVDQLEFNVKGVTKAIDKLGGGGITDLSPVINAIARGTQKWTGDPAYSELYYFMFAAGQESARILSGGQASVAQLYQGAAEEAKKWADANMTTPRAWKEGVAPAMLAEGHERLKTYERAIEKQKIGGGASPQRRASDAVPAVNSKGWPLMTDAKGNKAYVGPNKEIEEVR